MQETFTMSKEQNDEDNGRHFVMDSRYLGCFCYVDTSNTSLLTDKQLEQILEKEDESLLPETLKQQAD
jgi:hypothetical protein